MEMNFSDGLRERLMGKLGLGDVNGLCMRVDGDEGLAERLYELIDDEDDRVGYNALWVFTHLGPSWIGWLNERRNDLIDKVLGCGHVGKRRLLLTLLDRLPAAEGEFRGDYLDFCLAKMVSTEPYGVRALCMKLAYAQCRAFPELMSEFMMMLDMIEDGELSPGLRAAKRSIEREVGRKDG